MKPVLPYVLDHLDFSVVVKNRAKPPKPWRWEIYPRRPDQPDRAIGGLLRAHDRGEPRGKDCAQAAAQRIPSLMAQQERALANLQFPIIGVKLVSAAIVLGLASFSPVLGQAAKEDCFQIVSPIPATLRPT